jgi:hypothetical protein
VPVSGKAKRVFQISTKYRFAVSDSVIGLAAILRSWISTVWIQSPDVVLQLEAILKVERKLNNAREQRSVRDLTLLSTIGS